MASWDFDAGRRAVLTTAATVGVILLAGVTAAHSPARGEPAGARGGGPADRPAATATGPSARPAASPAWDVPSGTPTRGAGPDRGCPAATGRAVTQAPGTGRTVALTFDDGPGDATPALLDLLRRRRVHATFFVVGGAARQHPDLVAREAAEGHLVGDHTWHHRFPRQVVGGWTRAYLRYELTRTDQVITAATGRPVCWFRPPGGFQPASVAPVAHGLGMRVALWSVDPQDWALQDPRRYAGDTGPTADRIVARVSAGLAQQHPLILLHDGGGWRDATVAAVGRVIDAYRAHGYRFVRLDGAG